jgi:hypothetical protein
MSNIIALTIIVLIALIFLAGYWKGNADGLEYGLDAVENIIELMNLDDDDPEQP